MFGFVDGWLCWIGDSKAKLNNGLGILLDDVGYVGRVILICFGSWFNGADCCKVASQRSLYADASGRRDRN